MKSLVAIGLIFNSLAIALCIATCIEWRATKKLVAEGKTTVGYVTDAQHYSSSRRSRAGYFLVVAFVDDKRLAHSKMIEVGPQFYNSIAVGATVRVHYLPADPDVVQLGHRPRLRLAPFLESLFYVAFGIVVTGLCAFYVRQSPPRIHLPRSSTPTSGSSRNFVRS